MRRVSNWRSHDTASEFETHDNADLAQEFLCRNPHYQRDLAETATRIETTPVKRTSEWEGLARRWGLSFPLRAGPVTHRSSRPLVARNRARSGDPQRAAS